MEKLVAELKDCIDFKKTTETGDLVLIVAKKPEMLVYALITDIEHDPTRKDEWWHVHMHILTVPPQPMTWTLRKEQFTGQEIFTMGGEKRFIQAVKFPVHPRPPGKEESQGGKVKSMKKGALRIVK